MANRLAVITGASRGIGKSIAEEFASSGYDLIICCKNNIDALKDLAESLIAKYKVNVTPIKCDMADPNAVESLFKDIDSLDVLINNAGIAHMGLLSDMTYDDWHRVIDTNLSSAFYTCKNSIPLMLKSKQGKILNISSVWGNVGASTEVAYSASKGGLNSFTKALAKELAPSNIQVNAIACGLIDTDMNKCITENDLQDVINEIPADRIGKPEEVAKLALNICTGNDYLTGQIISLDGGWI